MEFLNKFFNINQQRQDDYAGYVYPPGSINGGVTFDGEQDPAAMGNNFIYDVDYYTMAKRAYTLITINEFARIAVTRLTQFVVGTGLKLHPEPLKNFIKKNFGEDIPEDFGKNIKELWSLFEEDKNVSSTKQDNIHGIAKAIFYNSYIAGDVLVIKRVKDGNLEYQVINGLSVRTAKIQPEDTVNQKNKIIDGVEINESGQHVAYYVYDEKTLKDDRIPARDSKGRLTAWLVPADDKRLGAVRGYSPLGAIMQKLHKIGQYSNSEVIAAETNAKFAAVIEQDKESSGINPLKGMAGVARGLQSMAATPTQGANTTEVKKFVDNVKRVASGIFFHMPKGQKMSSFDTKRPNVNYTQFVDGSMKYNYASLGIPHEIALLVFQSNFSASRAALKLFEMILKSLRKYTICDGFYVEVYKQFFELECLKGNIKAQKYLALKNDNGYLDNAYTKAKFIGDHIPHIDEMKEVNAVLAKIKGGLTTFEQALEILGNNTDFDTLIEQRTAEEKKIKDSGLDFETIITPDVTLINNNDEGA